MPQLQNLVLTDRATTPVSHTFTPQGINAQTGVATVTESNGILVGENRVTISTRRVNGKVKTRMVFTAPIVQTETVSGVSRPVVVREGIVEVNATFSLESSEQERNNLIGMVMSALGTDKALVHDTIVKAQNVY
ncbi:MAG: putative coat protein [Fenycovirus faecenecus]|uniref:Coat protein n=1 Tax=Leviviridae sp. TaxID=2027243 RepID=A0ABY3SS68_9VIRU|nr:MAG: putative coat protein [Leviviridae sp.]